MKSSTLIREMVPADIKYVSMLHAIELEDSSLGKLGPSFLRSLYQGMLQDPSFVCFVAVNNGRIVGYVAATYDPAKFYSRVCKRNFFQLGINILFSSFTNPKILISAFRIYKYSKSNSNSEMLDPELLSIAVCNNYKQQGIGKMLVKELFKKIMFLCSDYLTVLVDKKIPANLFYKSIGFINNDKIILDGREMYRYRISCKRN